MNSNITLHNKVETAFRNNPHLGFRRIDISQHEGQFVINGKVESYFEKQIAQETLRCVIGLEKIDNQLEVAWN